VGRSGRKMPKIPNPKERLPVIIKTALKIGLNLIHLTNEFLIGASYNNLLPIHIVPNEDKLKKFLKKVVSN
jgi:hypothetical protein